MATLKIWGRRNSTNVKKVLWCVGELELPFDHVDAGGVHGVVDTPEFRALNPNGLVPVLEDGATVLWESNAIVRYLSAAYSQGLLFPTDPATRAYGDRWMDWTSSTLAPDFRPLFWGLIRTAPENRDAAAIAKAAAAVASHLAIADAALQRTPYLSGQDFTMGDIPLGPFVHAWFHLPTDRPDLPALRAWYDRLLERPAFRREVATPLS